MYIKRAEQPADQETVLAVASDWTGRTYISDDGTTTTAILRRRRIVDDFFHWQVTRACSGSWDACVWWRRSRGRPGPAADRTRAQACMLHLWHAWLLIHTVYIPVDDIVWSSRHVPADRSTQLPLRPGEFKAPGVPENDPCLDAAPSSPSRHEHPWPAACMHPCSWSSLVVVVASNGGGCLHLQLIQQQLLLDPPRAHDEASTHPLHAAAHLAVAERGSLWRVRPWRCPTSMHACEHARTFLVWRLV